MTDLLSVRGLTVDFPVPTPGLFARDRRLRAVDSVDLDLAPGETLGIVGESGCGKSTLGRAILRLIPASAGSVTWLGRNLLQLSAEEMRSQRRDMQIIFQDPLAALNPRMTVGDIIAEPLRTFLPELRPDELKARVRALMDRVGLLPRMINRYPHEFSGGQCQRIGIARALALGPKLIICDEPVAALDVSIQAQIVNLLMELQRAEGLSLIFISHNLGVVRHICHRVLVLYLGRVVEVAPRAAMFGAPLHPYTQALLAAAPIADPALERAKPRSALQGDPPSPLDPPSGCAFRNRCGKATEVCADIRPDLEAAGSAHIVACHHWRG